MRPSPEPAKIPELHDAIFFWCAQDQHARCDARSDERAAAFPLLVPIQVCTCWCHADRVTR